MTTAATTEAAEGTGVASPARPYVTSSGWPRTTMDGEAPPGGATALPRAGETVNLVVRDGSRVCGRWVGLVVDGEGRAVLDDGWVHGWVLRPEEGLRRGTFWRGDLERAATGATSPTAGQEQDAEVRAVVQALALAVDRGDRAEAQKDTVRDRLVRSAHEQADAQQLCSSFDDFMETVGLPRRTREWDVTVSATVEVRLIVSAGSAEDARGCVTDEQVRDAAAVSGSWRWDVDEVVEN